MPSVELFCGFAEVIRCLHRDFADIRVILFRQIGTSLPPSLRKPKGGDSERRLHRSAFLITTVNGLFASLIRYVRYADAIAAKRQPRSSEARTYRVKHIAPKAYRIGKPICKRICRFSEGKRRCSAAETNSAFAVGKYSRDRREHIILFVILSTELNGLCSQASPLGLREGSEG